LKIDASEVKLLQFVAFVWCSLLLSFLILLRVKMKGGVVVVFLLFSKRVVVDGGGVSDGILSVYSRKMSSWTSVFLGGWSQKLNKNQGDHLFFQRGDVFFSTHVKLLS